MGGATIHAALRAALPVPAALCLLLWRTPLPAQQPDTLPAQPPDTLVVVTETEPRTEPDVQLPELDEPTTPGGAFLRAVLLPGWGHASIGSYRRGAFHFAAEATTGLLLARTLWRLDRAKDAQRLEEMRFAAALPLGLSQDSVAVLLDRDQTVDDARELVDARRQQVEDWIALGAFLVFLSGADAFVSAHLRDFPEPLGAEAQLVPGPTGLTAQLGIRVGLGP